jgi:hypothetical protein
MDFKKKKKKKLVECRIVEYFHNIPWQCEYPGSLDSSRHPSLSAELQARQHIHVVGPVHED